MSCGCGGSCGPEFDADREGVSADDLHKFDHDGMRCPSCGEELYDDVAMCSFCGHAVEERGDSSSAKWVVVTAGVVVVALVMAFAVF